MYSLTSERLEELKHGDEELTYYGDLVAEMASELLSLRQRVAETEWVKVSEGLPIAGKRYWVHMSNDYEVIATYTETKGTWKNDSGEFVANVTHYMPLPLPPRESEKESEVG